MTEIARRATGMPVETLRVDIVDGPDAGRFRIADAETLTIGSAEPNHLVVRDPQVSRFHAELRAVADGVLVVDHGSTNGTWFGAARLERAVVPASSVLRLGASAMRVGGGDSVTVPLLADEALAGLRGRSPAMRRLMAQVARVGGADTAVHIVGETGTGKELIASALHDCGPRRARPFVTVDCGSLVPSLIASELFGHERGAFTGADQQRIGAFERAHGGTLFLDEIGELPPGLQASLLGVLERRRFCRVGGRDEIAVDVRVVSATNRDLRAEVNRGAFRPDLFYRLAVIVIPVPALRERREDIPLLVEHFLRECGHHEPVEQLLSPAAMGVLAAHAWPGNVRELRNLVEATVAMGIDDAIGAGIAAHLPPGTGGERSYESLLEMPYRDARARLLAEFEACYLPALLARSKDNVSAAARLARMDRSYLIDLLNRHHIKK